MAFSVSVQSMAAGRRVVLESVGVRLDEGLVDHGARGAVFLFQQQVSQRLEQGQVPADLDLQELVGELGAAADQPVHRLRVLERHQPGFRQRVDGDDGAAVVLRSFSAESIRGWLVPGFWPATKISSEWWMSSSDTVPLPMPMVGFGRVPEDSWHMLEQSGRLLVPSARANSW